MADLNIQLNLRLAPEVLRGGLLIVSLLAFTTELGSENVTLTTYYPAPSGVYTQMITTGNTWLARENGNVVIGTNNLAARLDVTGTVSATRTILVGNLASDPLPADSSDGMLYYNTTSNKFRGRQAGAWTDWPTIGCPAGTVDAGSYCIEADERPPATWWNATSIWLSAGMTLCSMIQWYPACAAALPGLNNMLGNWEWMGDMAYWGQFQQPIAGNTTCGPGGTVWPPTSLTNFRCCRGK